MMECKQYAEVLQKPAHVLSVVGEGANGIVWTDGTGMAYKFPKHQKAAAALSREAALLKKIAGRLSVSVPEYAQTQLDRPVGEAFCAYPLLPGVTLTRNIYMENREGMSRQLLGILSEIHRLSPDIARKKNALDFKALYEELVTFVFPHISEDDRTGIRGKFEAYRSQRDAHPAERRTVHGDLGMSNLLCDPKEGRITAVLDWAAFGVDDPAVDYSSLTCRASIPELKEDFLKLEPSLSAVFARCAFIQFTFPLQEALHGVQTGDQKALLRGIQALRISG